jgi:tetratricopeptide (TPR) repeat protein
MSQTAQLVNQPIISSYQDNSTPTSSAAAAGILIGAGNDLFTNGYKEEAIAMFDAAYSLLQQFQYNGSSSQSFEMSSCYLSMVSRMQEAGTNVAVQDGVKQHQDTVSSVPWNFLSSDAFQLETDSGMDENDFEAPDLYQDANADVGPRCLKAVVKLDSMNQDFIPFEMRAMLIESIILFSKGLVCYSKGQILEAKQLYEVVAVSIQQMSTVFVQQCAVPQFDSFSELAMRVYNNIGVIFYHEHSTRLASCAFETSLQFAKDLALRRPQVKEIRLEYATILSNLCRVNWTAYNVSDQLYHRVSEVLSMRSSILGWDHPDVAAGHYNIALADYARRDVEKSKTHLIQYLSIASHLNPGVVDASKNQIENQAVVIGGRLEAIPALVMLLLIQNEDKEDHLSQELVRGLRSLQERRQVKGPNSPEVASVLNFVGTLLFHKSDFD